jgi:membrane-bound lytic murein transglycosylase
MGGDRDKLLKRAKQDAAAAKAAKREKERRRRQAEAEHRDNHAWARFDQRTTNLSVSQKTRLALDHSVDGVFQEVVSLRRALASDVDGDVRRDPRRPTGRTPKRSLGRKGGRLRSPSPARGVEMKTRVVS